jgi:hypothetical protein
VEEKLIGVNATNLTMKNSLIPLTQGKFAIVDDDDFNNLIKNNWHAHKHGQYFYARRSGKCIKGKRKMIFMAREILGLVHGDKKYVDHINHDTLDNRKANLRVCTSAENSYNRITKKHTSKYKGVRWQKRSKKWAAQIQYNHKIIHLGYFFDETTAARAYDFAALKYFGGFANLNFK